MSLKSIYLPGRYNYIACFLTLDCNLRCDYCINYFRGGNKFNKVIISKEKWIEGLNRLVLRDSLPITLQGGEPSLYPDFIWLINNIRKDMPIDILTNLCFDVESFMNSVDPLRLKREAPYPSIRVSYHHLYMDLEELTEKVLRMKKAGFSIGIFSILHPRFEKDVLSAQDRCRDLGIDFRTKEFLGEFDKQIYGTYFYPGAIGNGERKRCLCRTSELIIGPDAGVFRCHHDLYKDFPPIGNLLDPDFEIDDRFRECSAFGDCNPCDIKIKTDRHQVYGHTSVEINELKQETSCV